MAKFDLRSSIIDKIEDIKSLREEREEEELKNIETAIDKGDLEGAQKMIDDLESWASQKGGLKGEGLFGYLFYRVESNFNVDTRDLILFAFDLEIAKQPDFMEKAKAVTNWRKVAFIFPINPTKITYSGPKIIQPILTNSGYIFQNWGNRFTEWTFNGTTGRLLPDHIKDYSGYEELQGNWGYDVRKTRAWRAFKIFQACYEFYNGSNEANIEEKSPLRVIDRSSLITFSFWEGTYKGILDQFSYTLDAYNPFQILYSFKFLGIPSLTYSTVDQLNKACEDVK